MPFEYKTSFVDVQYRREKKGLLMFKSELPLAEPEIASSEAWQSHLDQQGADGWELVNAQPLLRGIYDIPQASHAGGGAISYSITAGFYLFWKRTKQAAN